MAALVTVRETARYIGLTADEGGIYWERDVGFVVGDWPVTLRCPETFIVV